MKNKRVSIFCEAELESGFIEKLLHKHCNLQRNGKISFIGASVLPIKVIIKPKQDSTLEVAFLLESLHVIIII